VTQPSPGVVTQPSPGVVTQPSPGVVTCRCRYAAPAPADLDEALEWATLVSAAELRPVEVRPLFEGDLEDAIRLNAAFEAQ
jgi:hypothetical protein